VMDGPSSRSPLLRLVRSFVIHRGTIIGKGRDPTPHRQARRQRRTWRGGGTY
jgi:hypothetical protein